jgi:hypothetical protein
MLRTQFSVNTIEPAYRALHARVNKAKDVVDMEGQSVCIS